MEEKNGAVKITSLELENVKRVRAVSLQPAEDGLTVIGGRNAQGKTSVLDAIAWALGGNRKRPERPTREGSATPASLRVELSNGLLVERGGKGGTLKITDPTRKKAGQALLDSFVEELALNLPKFMEMSDREKADEMLRILGIQDDLEKLDRDLMSAKNKREAIGQMKRAKEHTADEMPVYGEVGTEPMSAKELIEKQQEILAKNGENQRKRLLVDQIKREFETLDEQCASIKIQISALNESLEKKTVRLIKLKEDYETAQKTASELEDDSTAEIEESLANIEDYNSKIAANRRRAEMKADAEKLQDDYRKASKEVDDIQKSRVKLLRDADLPLDGLTVDDGKLKYNGAVWSEMSGAEQLRVATAIVRKLKPECGFVLVDKLEQMDPETLAEFGRWAQEEGLQVIGTRVAVDDTCTVVIEDGRVVGSSQDKSQNTTYSATSQATTQYGGAF